MWTRQTNFSAGELAPLLWGRTDLAVWGRGLRGLRNFFVAKQGPVVSRPGWELVAEAPSTVLRDNRGSNSRLVPFVVSDVEGYALLFAWNRLYFYKNGARIETSPGVPYFLNTPYTGFDAFDLKWAQVGDVLTLTHQKYPPYELKRFGETNWTLTPVDCSMKAPEWFLTDNAAQATTAPMLMNVGTTAVPNPLFSLDAAHPSREWRWLVTAVMKNWDTLQTVETRAFEVAQSSRDASTFAALPADRKVVLYKDAPVTLRRHYQIGYPGLDAPWRVEQYNYYRGRAGLFGYVGSTKTIDFVDFGEEPDYRIQPPKGKQPFTAVQTVGPITALGLDYPGCVSFFEERRVFGGMPARPSTLLFSATDAYDDFDDESPLPIPTQALTYTLASRRRETIKHLVSHRRLLVFSDGAVRSFGGSNMAPVSPETLPLVQVEDEQGAAGPIPLVVGGAVLYVRARGRGVRALVVDQSGTGYRPIDISYQAQHLFVGEDQNNDQSFAGRSIVDWAYQADPWGVVWAVRSDGALLSLTFDAESGVWGWARHDSYGTAGANAFVGVPDPWRGVWNGSATYARFMSVCVVPENGEDVVYALVHRGLGSGQSTKTIERLSSRVVTGGPDDWVSVDCSVRYEGAPTATFNTGNLPKLATLEGQDVYFIAKNTNPIGPLKVTGGAITLPAVPAANAIDTATGLTSKLIARIGLLFTADMELLDVVGPDLRAKQKTVVRVGFEVSSSLGLAAGQDADHLTEWRQRNVLDQYGSVSPSAAMEVVTMPVAGKWDTYARAFLRQTKPLPVTVLGLLREVDSGG